MMKSKGHFPYPSKIFRRIVWYLNPILQRYDEFDWVGSATNKNITPTYCRKRSVSLSATKDEYIAAEKKEFKDSSSDEDYDREELYR